MKATGKVFVVTVMLVASATVSGGNSVMWKLILMTLLFNFIMIMTECDIEMMMILVMLML